MIEDVNHMSIILKAKEKVIEQSRKKKLRYFYSHFKNGDSVLDVGVAVELKEGLQARNYFLKNYRYGPETYTGLGVQDLSGMSDLFPGKRFVQYSGGQFPFSERLFYGLHVLCLVLPFSLSVGVFSDILNMRYKQET